MRSPKPPKQRHPTFAVKWKTAHRRAVTGELLPAEYDFATAGRRMSILTAQMALATEVPTAIAQEALSEGDDGDTQRPYE